MAEPQDPRAWRSTVAPRLGILAVLLVLWVAAVVGRLLFLQILHHDEWLARRRSQVESIIKVPAERGEILDRHGKVLAMSVEADTVCARRSRIPDPVQAAARLCQALGDCDGSTPMRDPARLARNLARGHGDATIRRQITPEQSRRVAALEMDGVYFIQEPRRWYPNRELAANLLGTWARKTRAWRASREPTTPSCEARRAPSCSRWTAARPRGPSVASALHPCPGAPSS